MPSNKRATATEGKRAEMGAPAVQGWKKSSLGLYSAAGVLNGLAKPATCNVPEDEDKFVAERFFLVPRLTRSCRRLLIAVH